MSEKTKQQLLDEIADLRKQNASLKKSLQQLQSTKNEIKESEQGFQALAEATFEAVVVSEKGICLDANKAATELFGFTYQELIGMRGTRVIAPGSKKMVKEKTIAGYEEPYEALAQRKDGSKFWAEFRGKMYDYKGKRVRVTAIRDISSRKKAEEELKEKADFYHALFDLSPSGILLEDKHGKILDANPAFCKSMKYARKELIGKNVEILAHKDNKKKVQENIKQLLSGKKIQQVLKSYRKDGTECYMQLNERSIILPDGKKGILSISQDMTDQMHAELKLKRSEEQFRILVQQSPLAIEILDNKGYLVEVNKAWENLWGVKSKGIINKYNVFKNPVLKQMGAMTYVKRAFNGEEINLPDIEYDPAGSGYPGRKCWVHSKIYSIKDIHSGEIKNVIAIHEDITARKKAEIELKESEEKFKILAEKSPNMIFINLMGRIVYVNKKCEELMGYTKKEFYSPKFDFTSLISKEYVALVKENFNRQDRGIDVESYEYNIVTKKGQLLYVIIATKIINYEGQKAILGIITDISERKKAADALIESEKRFREVSNLTSDYAYCFRVESDNSINVEWVTGALSKITGYTREELQEKGGWESLLYPDDMKIALKQLKSLLSGKSAVVEYRIVKKDGTIGWMRDYARPEKGKSGKYVQFIYGAVQEITDQKKAEIEIKRLATLVEQSVESIIITDSKGTINYVNSAFEKITGYKFEEAIGKNPRILKSGKQTTQFYKEMWKKISRGSKWEGIIINKRKNGKLYYEKAVIFPIKDESGNIINYAGIMRDITMERKLENQLQQIQKMEAIGTLSGGVAHDFNNLLTVINGHAELALMKISQDQRAYNDLLAIFNAGKKAERLTSQLLAFSRKQIHELKVVDINHIISNLEKMLRRLIPEDIFMELDLFSDLPYIKADPSQIEQVIINLVINARDAINENKDPLQMKQIKIKTQFADLDDLFVLKHPGSHSGPHILITLQDSGIGMDAETSERIFEPFFTTKEVNKGTGLGLATVYGIIKQNSGSIYVKSEEGKGSIFSIYWPTTEELLEPEDAQKINHKALAGNEHILIVEDDESVRNFASGALRGYGYIINEAINGKNAIELMKSEKLVVNLLITDLIMPEMNGKELANQISKIVPIKNVLFVSGYPFEHLAEEGKIDEGINFLQKPYSIKNLLKKIREILDNE